MILEELKKENINALKQHDNVLRGILSVLLNKIKLAEVEKRTKNEEIGDADIINIIMKTCKELEDEKAGYESVNNLLKVEEINRQSEFIKQYLPKMLTYEEIVNKINNLEDKSIPTVMKYFKTNYAGQVDMALVNKAVKEINNK